MTGANQYDRMNDPELGSGIYDVRVNFKEQFLGALNRLQELDPDWEAWYDGVPVRTNGEMLPLIEARIVEIEANLEKLKADEAAGVDVDKFLMLTADPLAGDWAADMRDEDFNRRPEVCF